MKKYELTPLTGSERREDYDASENAATSSEFETAALRFSQSQRPVSCLHCASRTSRAF